MGDWCYRAEGVRVQGVGIWCSVLRMVLSFLEGSKVFDSTAPCGIRHVLRKGSSRVRVLPC